MCVVCICPRRWCWKSASVSSRGRREEAGLLSRTASFLNRSVRSRPDWRSSCRWTCVPSSLCLMQNTKAGWFSGWFKSKPKDVKKESAEEGSPAQTVGAKSTQRIKFLIWWHKIYMCIFVCFPRSCHLMLASLPLPCLPSPLRAHFRPCLPLRGSIPFQGKQVNWEMI